MMGNPFSFRRVLGCFALLAFVFPTMCLAGAGTSFKLPMNKRPKNGIIAHVNTWWVDGFGHRPVRIRLSVRKAKQDRTITVRLLPNSYSYSHEPLRIETEIEIPEGEKEVSKTIYIPQGSYLNYFRLDFFENGKKLKDLSMDRGVNWNQNYYNGGERPCVLIVDPDAPSLNEDRQDVIKKLRTASRKSKGIQPKFPNVETISFLALNYNEYQQDEEETALDIYRDVDSLTIAQSSPNLELIPPTDLPTSHVGLASVDLLVMSASDMQALHQDDHTRFRAIDSFVRNGGNLIVFGQVGIQQLASELLQQKHVWTKSNAASYFRSPGRFRSFRDEGSEDLASRNVKLRTLLNSFPDFYIAKHGYGRVLVSDAEDPFVLPATYWRFMTQTIGSDRLSWIDRHGIALNSDNTDFWDFLIPGYGATPVVTFLSVITFFVVCIGPINFFVLKRIKRFYLLPFTVVLAALATTSVMMAYAFLSDGVERRVRLRSFTHLDQRSDSNFTAATHCRHAYLASVAPKDGLVFPERTLAYPIVAKFSHNARFRQRVNSKKQERTYHYGYIGSRSTSQFLTTDVQPTENALLITDHPDGTLRATNRLGVKVQHAWVIDAHGEVVYGTDCDAGDDLKLVSVEKKDARKLLQQILLDNRPKPPDGLDKANSAGFGGLSTYASKMTYADAALLNSEMTACTQELLRGTPYIYVVITRDAPSFVEQGLSASEEAGFHVIRGSWSP